MSNFIEALPLEPNMIADFGVVRLHDLHHHDSITPERGLAALSDEMGRQLATFCRDHLKHPFFLSGHKMSDSMQHVQISHREDEATLRSVAEIVESKT